MSERFNIRDHFQTLSVLDKGHVELNDGMVIEPKLKVVNSARVSFLQNSTEFEDKDAKLIKYLMEHEHYSTFRHSYFTFGIKAPLFVFRQWWKYQVGSHWEENESGAIIIPGTGAWNEQSGRYTKFEPEFCIPEHIRIQSKNNKQGSGGILTQLENGEDPVKFYEAACNRQYEDYKYMIKSGAAKEQCRGFLPQNIYSACYWTCSLQTILFFLHQRMKPDAQFEIREYAKGVWGLIKPIFSELEEESWG